MFVRRKMIGKRERFYLVENTRQDGKVRQKVLAYLGEHETLDDAITQLERWMEVRQRNNAEINAPGFVTMRGTRHTPRSLAEINARDAQQRAEDETRLAKLKALRSA